MDWSNKQPFILLVEMTAKDLALRIKSIDHLYGWLVTVPVSFKLHTQFFGTWHQCTDSFHIVKSLYSCKQRFSPGSVF